MYSSGNPYLKILDFSQLFVADASMKKNLLEHTLQKINRQILKKKIKRVANLSKLCMDKSANHTFMSLFVLPLSMPVSPTLSPTQRQI